MSTPPPASLRESLGGLRLAQPWATALAIACRPSLWSTAIRLSRRAARRGWWHRRPVSPLPPASYVAFRSETMLGTTDDRRLASSEVLAYLRWCRRIAAVGG